MKNKHFIFFPDRLITSKDHASVQIVVADVDAQGLAMSTNTTFALCGQVRSQGESDNCINWLATKAGRKCLHLLYPRCRLTLSQCSVMCSGIESDGRSALVCCFTAISSCARYKSYKSLFFFHSPSGSHCA